MIEYAKVTEKGQITIPVAVRRALGLRPGDRVRFERNAQGAVILSPNDALETVFGSWRGKMTSEPLSPNEEKEAIRKGMAESAAQRYRRSFLA